MAGIAEGFDAAVSRTDPAMIIVTASTQGRRAGCLVGFHTQSSIEPRHYCVWISTTNHTAKVVPRADAFAVHMLGQADLELATLFGSETGDDIDKFDRCEYDDHPLGPPLLARCANRLVLRRLSVADDGGDHVCVTGRLVESQSSEAPFTALRLSSVRDLRPGHRSRE